MTAGLIQVAKKTDEKTDNVWVTADFPVAVYLFMRGVKIKSIKEIPGSRTPQWNFFFEDTYKKNGEFVPCSQLEIDFLNSESYSFDAAQRALKKVCMRGRNRR